MNKPPPSVIFKILKIIVGISFVLLVSSVITLFVLFPQLFEEKIEKKLSELSGLTVDISQLYLDFTYNKLIIGATGIQIFKKSSIIPIVAFNEFKASATFYDLLKGDYYANDVYIEKLNVTIDATPDNFVKTDDIANFINIDDALAKLNILSFFKSLTINKTIFNNGKDFILEPIFVNRDNAKIVIKTRQKPNFNLPTSANEFGITVSFPVAQYYEMPLSLLISVSHDNFFSIADLKFFNKGDDKFVEFSGTVSNIDYFISFLDKKTRDWLDRSLIGGKFENTHFKVVKNLLKDTKPLLTLSTRIRGGEFLFNSKWQPAKDIDANIVFENKKLNVFINSANLNEEHLINVEVQASNLNSKKLHIIVFGNIDTSSERLIKFLKSSPIGDKVHRALEKINLQGEIAGSIGLYFYPYEKTKKIITSLTTKNNHLSMFNNKLNIDNLSVEFTYHNNGHVKIKGIGDIKGSRFNINFYTENIYDNSLFDVRLTSIDNKLKIYIHKQKNDFNVRLDTGDIKGSATIVTQKSKISEVIVHNLHILTSGQLTSNWNIKPKDIPSMHLFIKNVYVDNYKLPDITVDLESQEGLLVINNLAFTGVGVGKQDLNFSGDWVDGKIDLVAKAKGDSFSDFLNKLNIKEKVKGGSFNFYIKLFCDCNPWEANLSNISGIVKIDIQKGEFVGKNNVIGKLLSLFSIKSLANILTLKMDEIIKEDFVYDNIKAEFDIGESVVKIKQFDVQSVLGDIKLTGQSSLIDKTHDLKAEMFLDIADNVPIITYLAGGGIAGLGLWLFDKFLFSGGIIDGIINKSLVFKYSVTGDWKDPIIAKISYNTN